MCTLSCPTHMCFPCWSTAFPAQWIADTSSGVSFKSAVVLRVICEHGPYKETKDIWGHFRTNGIWGLSAGLLPHSPVFCRLSCSCPACAQVCLLTMAHHRVGELLAQETMSLCSRFVRGKTPSQDCANWGNSKFFFWLHLSKYSIAITTVFLWQVNECISSVLQASFEHKREWFRCSRGEKASFYNYSSFFQYFAFLP